MHILGTRFIFTTVQTVTARTEQTEERAAELQDVVDTLNARILSLEPDLARLQTTNAEQAQEHATVLADLAHISGTVTSVKTALHEVGAEFAELVRATAALLHSAQALAGNIVEQNIRLTAAIKTIMRHSAGVAAARSALENPLQDVNAARTAGVSHQLYTSSYTPALHQLSTSSTPTSTPPNTPHSPLPLCRQPHVLGRPPPRRGAPPPLR